MRDNDSNLVVISPLKFSILTRELKAKRSEHCTSKMNWYQNREGSMSNYHSSYIFFQSTSREQGQRFQHDPKLLPYQLLHL
jgi:hypothetical protein